MSKNVRIKAVVSKCIHTIDFLYLKRIDKVNSVFSYIKIPRKGRKSTFLRNLVNHMNIVSKCMLRERAVIFEMNRYSH